MSGVMMAAAGPGPTRIGPGRIVVGIDGSLASEAAVGWAVEQAVLEHRDVTLVHVVGCEDLPGPLEDRPVLEERPVDIGRAILASAVELAHERAESYGHGLGLPRPTVATAMCVGDSRDVLIELSRRAFTVVIGARGLRAARGRSLGSVALAVSDQGACPVVVVPPPTPRGPEPSRVLVGIDGTEASEPALAFAFRQAALLKQPLLVTYCVEASAAEVLGPGVAKPHEPRFRACHRVLSVAVEQLRETYPEVDVELLVGRGTAEQCLVIFSDDSTLVVVGNTSKDRVETMLFGDVSAHLVSVAGALVAVVPACDQAPRPVARAS